MVRVDGEGGPGGDLQIGGDRGGLSAGPMTFVSFPRSVKDDLLNSRLWGVTLHSPTGRRSTHRVWRAGRRTYQDTAGLTLATAVHPLGGSLVHHDDVIQDTALRPSDLPTIDVAQAARYLDISERSVRRLVAS